MASARPFGSFMLGADDQSAAALRVRVQVLLTTLLVSTNVVGALIVVALSGLVLPGPRPSRDLVLTSLISVPVYIVVAVLIGTLGGTRGALHSLRWINEEREPSRDERRATLRVPWRLTVLQSVLWAVAVVVFTLQAVLMQPALAITIFLTVTIAGIVVCAVAYLLGEFALRPVAARALSDDEAVEFHGAGVERRMVLFWSLGTGAPTAGVVLTAILTLTRENVTLTKLAVIIIVLGMVVAVFGLLVTVLNARAVVAPIRSVRDALLKVQGGEFDVEVPVYDGTELGMLQSGFNQMVSGLRERERIRDLFGKHVGREVADAAVLRNTELGGETRVVTVLFTDLIASTTMATEREPSEVVELLNRFCGVVVDEVDARHGLVNKFMGDAVLAIFGAPMELEDHPAQALAAARAIAARLRDEVPEVDAGIGVATGEVVAGNVGDLSRFEYTVIGDAVNQAARLTELAKNEDDHLLVAFETVQQAGDEEAGHWEQKEAVTLRGRSEETVVALPTRGALDASGSSGSTAAQESEDTQDAEESTAQASETSSA